MNYLSTRRPHRAGGRPGATRAGRALVLLGTLGLATGLAVAPSAAAGESTTATLTSPLSGPGSTTFTWSYQFNPNGGHALSNIAVGLCSTDLLAHVVSASPSGETFTTGDVPGGHTGFGPGIKFATTAVNGTLTVVFDQPYTAGGIVRVQSHSGDGAAGDLVTEAAGPGTCGNVTTTAPATTTTAPATATTAPATTTTAPATTTTAPATATSVRAATTAPPATTTTQAGSPTTVAVSGTAATGAATTSTSVPTSVLGSRFVNDDPAADLAGTGFHGGPLVAFGALCLALGALLAAGGRLQKPLGDG